ncbi:MAG: CtsR family transcriptional regulator, partial [Gorillibacterium sp.]|nr:CtsR family transcriptional regulator [Gorillibacterium sp.]
LDHILDTIGNHIDQNAAEGLIYQLQEGDFITRQEANLMKAAMSRDILILKLPLWDEIRARLLKAMLLSLLSQ